MLESIYETGHLNLILVSLIYFLPKGDIGFVIQTKIVSIVMGVSVQKNYYETKWLLFIFRKSNTEK